MFGIGLPEMILIMALALIVVGPDKLPEMARSIAKGVLELKKTVSAVKENLAEDNPFDAVKPELEDAAKSLQQKLGDPSADGWSGILPDEGVNAPDKEPTEHQIIESEPVSVVDATDATVDPYQEASRDNNFSEPTDSSEAEVAGRTETGQPKDEDGIVSRDSSARSDTSRTT